MTTPTIQAYKCASCGKLAGVNDIRWIRVRVEGSGLVSDDWMACSLKCVADYAKWRAENPSMGPQE